MGNTNMCCSYQPKDTNDQTFDNPKPQLSTFKKKSSQLITEKYRLSPGSREE